MKKRSLFAAVAMLIVSAVVLTSATYAWFAGNASVAVQTISANVNTSDGSILISPDNTDWSKTTLTAADFTESTENIPSASAKMNPIDVDANCVNLRTASFGDSGTTITINGAASPTDYTHFDFYLKSPTTANQAVKLKATFGDSTNYGYAAVKIGDGSWTIISRDANGYTPLAVNTGNTTDNGDFVIGEGDAGYAGLIATTPQAIGVTNGVYETNITLGDIDASTKVDVIMWAEGQDLQCTKAVDTSAMSIGFEITLA